MLLLDRAPLPVTSLLSLCTVLAVISSRPTAVPPVPSVAAVEVAPAVDPCGMDPRAAYCAVTANPCCDHAAIVEPSVSIPAIEECSSATYVGWYESVCGGEPRD